MTRELSHWYHCLRATLMHARKEDVWPDPGGGSWEMVAVEVSRQSRGSGPELIGPGWTRRRTPYMRESLGHRKRPIRA